MLDFENYNIEAIKIDTQPIYKSDLDSDWFKTWIKSGKAIETDKEWNECIKKRVLSGAKHIRIKIIDKDNPVALEIQNCAARVIYPEQIKAGAQYYFITRSDFYELVHKTFKDGWQPNDFWLFDLCEGLEQFYNSDYSYRNAKPMSLDIIKNYVKLREVIIKSKKLFNIEEFKNGDFIKSKE